ncbi:MAG: RNA polymerase sigma factor [Wendovervirus sonii]|uniref:RNA polymerase sigma factor n=1 Tax=phage Lak_Megaphage_Sonny TaxID=3109229 RepID=A0ABZ0Z618_9CAUD|nr:MAG: RNA polymerase sigma factor [phage Lak_Megaphage_Sonny]
METIEEKIIEQTEEMVKQLNIENLTDSDFDKLEKDEINEKDVADTLDSMDVSKIKSIKGLQKSGKKTMSQMADEIVNAYIADRSDKNWTAIQEFFWYGIKKWAYHYTHSLDDADDMTIETFETAHEKFDTFDPNKGRFSTWLFTCCRNNCLGLLKKKAKIPTINKDISEIYDSTLVGSLFAQSIDDNDYKMSGDGQMDIVDSHDVIQQMYNVSINEMQRFRGLPKTIMEMKLLQDMKIREIADELNMNESTVKNHLYRSLKDLSNILKKKHTELYESYRQIKYNENQQVLI